MSWIRNSSDDLLNLDKVVRIEVLSYDMDEREVDEPEWAVIATMEDESQQEIFAGTFEGCNLKIDQIAAKMPVVRV